MAIIRATGFESGSTSELASSGGTFTFATSGHRTGTYALQCNPTTTAVGWVSLGAIGATGVLGNFNNATLWMGFAFKAVTAPSADSEPFLQFADSGSAQKLEIRLTSTGKIAAYNSAGTLITTGATTVGSTYVYVEVKCGTGASAAWEVKINGTTEISGTTDNLGTNNTAIISIGKRNNRNGRTVDFYFDDLYVDDAAYLATTTATPEVRILIPNAAGASAGWTNGLGTTFAQVDEIPPESDGTDASYIQASATEDNQYHVFAVEDTATKNVTGTISAVSGFVWAKTGSVSGTSTVAIRMRSSTTNSDATGLELTTSYQGLHRLLVQDPATSAAWGSSGVDGVQVGMTAGTIAQTQRFSAAYVFVLALVTTVVSLSPTQGAITISGLAPIVTQSISVTPGVGSLALTGLQPAVTTQQLVTPAIGAATLTGLQPTRQVISGGDLERTNEDYGYGYRGHAYQDYPRVFPDDSRELTPAIGLVTISGLAPSVQIGYALAPAIGSLTLTGLQPAVTTQALVSPDIGLLTFSGLAPSVTAGITSAPDIGVLTLTGLTPDVATQHIVTPSIGAITLTGLQPASEVDHPRVPDIGALTLTGLQPSVTVIDSPVTPNVGLITLSGLAPTVTQEISVTPDVGAVTLTGLQPAVTIAHLTSPAIGLVTLTGLQPSISVGSADSISPLTGVVTLSGLAPTLILELAVTPAVGVLTWNGLAPSLEYALVSTPGVGSITFTGLTPNVAVITPAPAPSERTWDVVAVDRTWAIQGTDRTWRVTDVDRLWELSA